MIRALMWKEWREQRTIALAIFAFGVLALFLTAQFAPVTGGGSSYLSRLGARELMAPALAYLAGAVCGAMLLADEKEVGTMEFLDALPCLRRGVWIGKAAFGLVLTLLQATILAVLAVELDCVDSYQVSQVGYGMFVVLVGLQSLAWGMFGGAIARSTLGAVFQGSLGAALVGTALAIPFVLLFGQRQFSRSYGIPLMAFYTAWLAIGLAGSAVMFSRLDWRSRPAHFGTTGVRAGRSYRVPGFGALVWLTTRQAVWIILGAGAAGLVIGGVMVAPDVWPLFVWPGATLGIGVLAGVTALGEEQTRGVGRFWAERRLPLGRLWLTKVLIHFLIGVIAAFLMFLPLWIADGNRPFRTRLLGIVRPEIGRFLLIGLVYGFVVGHLAGLIFRKTVVAGLAAGVTAATLVGLIVPSLLGGGLSWWQAWGPALVLLVTARLILYPWATERVLARGPALRVAGGVVAAAALLATGIAYRVYEIPGAPDRLATSGFVESLPSYEANKSGQTARGAASQFRRVAGDTPWSYQNRPRPVPAGRGGARSTPEWMEGLERTSPVGWGAEGTALKPWLDQVFADNWHRQLDDLATRAVGVYDDPRNLDYANRQEETRDLRAMTIALRLRGLQRQAEGDPDTYLRLLRGGLAAARTARNKGGLVTVTVAFQCEDLLLSGFVEWLAALDGRADLLRSALDELDLHERQMPVGADDTYWAEQVILRNTMERVSSWLPANLVLGRVELGTSTEQADAEADLVATCWAVPWERLRRERILRLNTHPDRHVDRSWLSGLQYGHLWRTDEANTVTERDTRGVALRRLARLQVALRLYQLDHGRPAATLAELVPTCLAAVPDDPYTGAPFRYRLSAGESVETAREDPTFRSNPQMAALVAGGGVIAHATLTPTAAGPSLILRGTVDVPLSRGRMRIAAGSGVLWSAGPDGHDDGGVLVGVLGARTEIGEDWVIVIPRLGR
ncbi:MAG TPA: hypothetical protein VKD90_23400 [Gemmataceae bacterium]|nr:hypothetical protein [Gemmataceae bacterium]